RAEPCRRSPQPQQYQARNATQTRRVFRRRRPTRLDHRHRSPHRRRLYFARKSNHPLPVPIPRRRRSPPRLFPAAARTLRRIGPPTLSGAQPPFATLPDSSTNFNFTSFSPSGLTENVPRKTFPLAVRTLTS